MLAAVERIRPYPRPRERLPALARGRRAPLVSGRNGVEEGA